MIGRSKDIPEALFKRFFAKVSGVTAQSILAKLAKSGPIYSDAILDKDLLAFDPNAADALDILSTLGFVETDTGFGMGITPSGKQFVERTLG